MDCQQKGFDFSYGCVNNFEGKPVQYCGYGSGAECTIGAPSTCDGVDRLVSCYAGRTKQVSCLNKCRATIGVIGPYEFGSCVADQDQGAKCDCCYDSNKDGYCDELDPLYF